MPWISLEVKHRSTTQATALAPPVPVSVNPIGRSSQILSFAPKLANRANIHSSTELIRSASVAGDLLVECGRDVVAQVRVEVESQYRRQQTQWVGTDFADRDADRSERPPLGRAG